VERLTGAWPGGSDARSDVALEETLRELIGDARREWPRIGMAPELLEAHLARLAPEGEPPVEWLRSLHFGDLYLARACALGDSAAIALFEERHGATVRTALARARVPAAMLDDVAQDLLEHLLIGGASGPPKLATYSGRGSLAAWLKVVATRFARRQAAPVARDDEARSLEAFAAPGLDPELALARARDVEEFKRAFEEAIVELAPEQRLLIAQYYLDRLTIDDLSRMYGVHRTSALRRVASCRAVILESVRRKLEQRIALGEQTVGAWLDDLGSNLGLSLSRVLRAGA
jgi:RNA polymerase sigma-70 factor (ECF subfamily)